MTPRATAAARAQRAAGAGGTAGGGYAMQHVIGSIGTLLMHKNKELCRNIIAMF